MLMAFFLFLLIFLISYGSGRRLLRLFGFRFSPLTEFALSVGLGYGLLSFVMMLLGFLSLFYIQVFAIVLLVFFLFSVSVFVYNQSILDRLLLLPFHTPSHSLGSCIVLQHTTPHRPAPHLQKLDGLI